MNFIDPIFFRIRTIVHFIYPIFFCIRTIAHCVTNLSWFCNQTSYIMFPTLINKSPDPSPQFISEEDNETESENEILCTPKPKRLRKSNKKKVLWILLKHCNCNDLYIYLKNTAMIKKYFTSIKYIFICSNVN